jgi:hypothetical protein
MFFCTPKDGKLNLNVSDSLAAKFQIIHKIRTIVLFQYLEDSGKRKHVKNYEGKLFLSFFCYLRKRKRKKEGRKERKKGGRKESLTWWHTSTIPALVPGKLGIYSEFMATLGFIIRPCLRNKQTKSPRTVKIMVGIPSVALHAC